MNCGINDLKNKHSVYFKFIGNDMKKSLLLLSILASTSVNAYVFKDNTGQLCLELKNGDVTIGNDIVMSQCDGQWNQNFTYDDETLQLKLAGYSEYCASISDDQGKLNLMSCHDGQNQKFEISDNKIKPQTSPEKCLTYQSDDSVEEQDCQDIKEQHFDIPQYGDDSSKMFSRSSIRQYGDRTFLITSDPQMTCGSNCGFSAEETRQNVHNQYAMFEREYPNASALIINGDLTSYGHGHEWADFYSATTKITTIPILYGLGNHDIFNNMNDCWENNCTVRSFMNFYYDTVSRPGLVSFDARYNYGYHFPEIRETLEGSLSYASDIDGVVIIQLNDYQYDMNPQSVNQYVSGEGKRFVINRYQDFEYSWLQEQLHKAREQGKVIIVNQHRYNADAGRLNEILDRYDVKLRFSGHYHRSSNDFGVVHHNDFIQSGSSARGEYLKLVIDKGENVARVYKSTGKNSPETTLFKEINLDRYVDMPETPYVPSNVIVKNDGAYAAFMRVEYTDNGVRKGVDSGKMLAGNVFTAEVPARATDVRISARNNTGLAWQPQKVIFDLPLSAKEDFCAVTWGTTLHPRWGYTTCNR